MTDTVPDQRAIIAALSDQWDRLTRLVDGLPEDRWRTASPLPGWTVFDVLAHITGTESLLAGEPTPELEVGGDHIHNAIGALNEKWIASLRPLSGAELLTRFHDVTAGRLKTLAGLSAQAWAEPGPSPVGMTPYGRFMRIRVFDCWMHTLDIADALGVSIDEGGTQAETAFPEVIFGLGRAVVKGGGAPEGARVTFELTGPVARTLHVAVVGGRANLVETLDGPADVVLTLDSGLFARLRGGRTTADAHLGEFTIAGDTELGNRLVRGLTFTI